MVDYIKTRKEILNIFYNTFSGDTLYTMPKEEIANALDEILLDGVKFKHATNGLTPLIRAALKEAIKDALSSELFIMADSFVGTDSVNKLVKLWKGQQ